MRVRPRRSPSWSVLDPRKFIDLLYLCLSFLLAYSLRFEFIWPEAFYPKAPVQLALTVVTQFSALHAFGGYRLLWRLFTMHDVRIFAKATAASFVVLLALRFLLPDSLVAVPVSISLLATVLGFGGLVGMRLMRRLLHERMMLRTYPGKVPPSTPLKRVLLLGAGQAGIVAVTELEARGGLDLAIKGFVDDDPHKTGRLIQGLEVLGTSADLPRLVPRLGIEQVIITIASIRRADLDRIVKICQEIPVKTRIIPGLHELLGGRFEVKSIRDVRIEDLLGREQVHLDEELIEGFLAGRTVLVTGAGGSIGSELCRQAARFKASPLLLVERAEGALFEIHQDLGRHQAGRAAVPLIADICDQERMRWIFEHYRPEVLVHAAAHKHVYMMERDPLEALKNNVLASRMLAEMAVEHGLDCFLQISTDKAVRPTSVMGASKRLAELAVQALAGRSATRFISVRFGNVLGSAGSVIPIFREQILQGGPVTVTHPDMVRYFMTIPEAVQLTLQAGAMGKGSEIFILDMGEPIRILDLARQMIRLMGFKPDQEIQIVFSGAKPGEKLFEELASDSESLSRTRHEKIFIGQIPKYHDQQIEAGLARLRMLAQDGDQDELRRAINEILPEARLRGGSDEPSPDS